VLDQFQKNLAAIQNQAASSGPATAAAAGQLNSITRQTQQLEQELIRQGNSAQAQQLRDALNKLTHALASPAPSAPPLPPAPLSGGPGTPPALLRLIRSSSTGGAAKTAA
jgi:hypothetical protein